MFSKSCEYAIKALIFIAKQSLDDRRTNLKEIAAGIGSPEAFTAKILQVLARHHFIMSQKGAGGGFVMESGKIKSVNLLNVVLAVDGDSMVKRCALGMEMCSDTKPCPFHEKYAPIRMDLIECLLQTTIQDLTIGLRTGLSVLK